MECLQPSEGKGRDADEFLGGFSTGAAMSLAVFTKASYFMVGVPIVGASLVFRGLQKKRLCGLAAGFGVVTLALLAYLRFDILKVVQDMRIAAAGRFKMMELHWQGMVLKLRVQVLSLLTLIVLWLYESSPQKPAERWSTDYQLLIWGLLVFAADLLLLFSNLQSFGMPLLAAFGFVVASRSTAARRRVGFAHSRSENWRYAFVLLFCGLLSLPQFCCDLVGLGYGAVQKAHPSAEKSRVRFSSPRLASMILYDWPSDTRSNGGVYTGRINEGVALLKQYCGPGDRVLNMDMVNPFPYALGWRPARGGMAAAAHNNLFTDELRPSDDEFFGDATAVMVPKEPALGDDLYDGFYRIYSPHLLQRYRLAAESETWRLYKRN